MSVLIITVGLSAIENKDVGKAKMSSNVTLRAEADRYLASRSSRVYLLWPELLDSLVRAHREFWQQSPGEIEAKHNRLQTSAELLSTYFLLKDGQLAPDEVVFLSSDTNEGEMAAEVNQRVFRNLPRAANVQSRVVRSPGLDLEMSGVTEGLLNCFRNNLRLHLVAPGEQRVPDLDVVCNITGGYKGTLPELSLIANANAWKLFYMNLEATEAVELKLSPLSSPVARQVVRRRRPTTL